MSMAVHKAYCKIKTIIMINLALNWQNYQIQLKEDKTKRQIGIFYALMVAIKRSNQIVFNELK